MKIQQKLLAALTMLLIMSGGFPALDVKADDLSEEVDYSAEIETTQNTVSSSDLSLAQSPAAAEEEDAVFFDAEIPAPMFSAYIEYTSQGYVVKGVFTEFSPDIISACPMYSQDGESWHICSPDLEWDLHWMNMEREGALEKLQTQVCLYSSFEPLSSYLAGKLDRFYLKLCLTREDGSVYDTQAAVIERGDTRSLPQDFIAIASFDHSVFVRQSFGYYGRYQLTVSTDATAEDIAALLPDTLPVEIQFQRGNVYVTKGTVGCPVAWKPVVLPQLIAGDSVSIWDAAEEIVIPDGTLVNTPLGIFQLNEPLPIGQYPLITDEIQLVLNVVAEDEDPTGVLIHENDGLEMAFDQKPTGATAIHAYTFSDDDSGWVELSGLSLLEEVNSQPSAANSGYALVVGDDSELFQRYLAEKAMGGEPTPFYVGLKLEGGVYDGHQLVLAWPDTYDAIPSLPNVGGAGGNEGNAGADNKGDSTEGGQRPNLPQDPTEAPEGEQPEQSQNPVERSEEENPNLGQYPDPGDESGGQQSDLPQISGDRQKEQSQAHVEMSGELLEQSQNSVEADPIEKLGEESLVLGQYPDSGDGPGGGQSDLPQDSGNSPKGGALEQQPRTDAGIGEITGRRSLVRILLITVIAISSISIIIVIDRGAAGRKSPNQILRRKQKM